MNSLVRSAARPCLVCPPPRACRALSSAPTPAQPHHQPTQPASPSPSSSPSNPSDAERWAVERARLIELVHKTRAEAQARWTQWLSSAQARALRRYKQLGLDQKLSEAGAKINHATGYEEIDRLRLSVGLHEKDLLELRTRAADSKLKFNEAMKVRTESQREVNDLLQRKSHWSSQDVIRFTELVQQDHENERAEVAAKDAMESAEAQVERAFTDLMQAILERYHEEQVWSDKIRSLSTYGSLGITSLNVLLFIVTILLVEPWRRKRLVERVEERLRTSTAKDQAATQGSLESLQSLLHDAQAKLDLLLAPQQTTQPEPELALVPASVMLDEPGAVQGADVEACAEPVFGHEPPVELTPADAEPTPAEEKRAEPRTTLEKWRGLLDVDGKDRELVLVGVGGALAGVGLGLLVGLASGR